MFIRYSTKNKHGYYKGEDSMKESFVKTKENMEDKILPGKGQDTIDRWTEWIA